MCVEVVGDNEERGGVTEKYRSWIVNNKINWY